MPNEPTENVYRDTEHRYLHDATFHAAVKMLEAAAERHGFTPGELKQIAFKAALNLEMRARPLMFISKGSKSTLMELVPEKQRGHFADGWMRVRLLRRVALDRQRTRVSRSLRRAGCGCSSTATGGRRGWGSGRDAGRPSPTARRRNADR